VILYRWQGPSSNFGDELNTLLWPRLLPGFFDGNPAVSFLGIGSVLDRRHASQAIKLVAGAGYGGYEGKPQLDENWIFH
jgi:succinoglycan biosynthesis protein ExoV